MKAAGGPSKASRLCAARQCVGGEFALEENVHFEYWRAASQGPACAVPMSSVSDARERSFPPPIIVAKISVRPVCRAFPTMYLSEKGSGNMVLQPCSGHNT